MFTDCNEREQFLRSDLNLELDTLVIKSLGLIKKHIFTDAEFVVPTKQTTIRTSKGEFQIPRERIVIELDQDDFLNNLSDANAQDVGLFCSQNGKIYLVKGMWCVQSVIHETLHACSISNKFPQLRRELRYIFEGLTEFYTGYILYKEHKDIFDKCWSIPSRRRCQSKYDKETRIWIAFHNFISLKNSIPFYFFNGDENWEKIRAQFIDSIHDSDFGDFQDPFGSQFSAADEFREECIKVFGHGYMRNYLNPDYSKIK